MKAPVLLRQTKCRFLFLFVFVPAVLLLFSGCAGKNLFSRPTAQSLEKRVLLEWELKKSGDWQEVYALTSKAYRKSHKKETFGKKSNVTIKDYEIDKLDLSEDMKKADVKVKFNVIAQGLTFTFYSKEVWIWENGNWYLTGK